MGILQLNQQRLLLIAGAVVFIAICIVGIFASQRQAPQADVATSYTSSITGQESVIFPAKGVEPGGNVPEVELYSFELFYDHYSEQRATSIIQQVRKFVDGVSGGRATVAGLVDSKITNKDARTSTIKLFINNPEATFSVTIFTENSDQQIPNLTFVKE